MSASSPRDGKATRPTRLPVLFVGHGNPMNALEDNVWSRVEGFDMASLSMRSVIFG